MNSNVRKRYSYADYLNWPEEERVELIDVVPYMLTPAPSRFHQQILLEIGTQFHIFLKGKGCEVNIAPFDVRFSESSDAKDEEMYSVVQPDLVIEVLSPSKAAHDYIRKMNLYEKHGVKEYWIVHPIDQVVMVHHLKDGKYERPEIFNS